MSGGDPETVLRGMSDRALRQAVETTESALSSTRHIERLVPAPDGGGDADDPGAEAADASLRLDALLGALEREAERRAREDAPGRQALLTGGDRAEAGE